MNPVVRAEVVGSLLRPAELKAARNQWTPLGSVWAPLSPPAGPDGLSTAQFRKVEDRAVDQAIALQESAGLDVVTDGEMRRFSFVDPVVDACQGITFMPGASMTWHGHEGHEDMEMPFPLTVTGKLRRTRSLAVEEFGYTRARSSRLTKVTLPGPLSVINAWTPEGSRDAYPNPFELFADVSHLVAGEARELAAMGCEYIQIDAPEFTNLCSQDTRDEHERRGLSPERILTEVVDLYNEIADVPGVRFAMHLCRGSFPTHFFSAGGYHELAERVLARATNFDVFLMEFDDERSGGFEPLATLPQDKVVVLGLVSTKKPRLESVEEIAARVDEASRFYPKDQLALSTQCGFGSGFIFESSYELQEAKLRLVGDVVDRIWG